MPLPPRTGAAPAPVGPALQRRAQAIALDVSRVEGEVQALAARRVRLVSDVSLAKGRLDLKPKVDQFLEQVQREADGRVLSRYQRLLNVLVGEVFVDETQAEASSIVLEVTTTAAGPGLDVLRECGGREDEREDVFADNGGSLTNVIDMGFRLIAAVRSGSARFLVFDEADNWLRSGPKVRAFYNVLRDTAIQLGIQCLVISHHDATDIGTGTHPVHIRGYPKDEAGTLLVNAAEPPPWDDAQAGIRWVRFKDFQAFADTRLDLSPGVTGVVGDNNRGKSTINRAFRAAFYGDTRASLVRHRAPMATVDFGVAGGRFLRYTRRRRGTPKNQWSFHEADGSVVEENGTYHEAPDQPAWVDDIFRLGRVQDLDVHFLGQKTPVFILNKNAVTRASVLSVGREGSYIPSMRDIHRARCTEDRATVRRGEEEVTAIDRRLAAIGEVATLRVRCAELVGIADAVDGRERDAVRVEARAAGIEAAVDALAASRARLAALAAIPEPRALQALVDDASVLRRRAALADGLGRASAALAAAVAGVAVLADMPAEPALAPCDGPAARADAILAARARLEGARARGGALALLPAAVPQLVSSKVEYGHGVSIRKARDALAAARASLDACSHAPASEPALGPVDGPRARLAGVEAARAALADAKVRAARLRADEDAVKADIEEAFRLSGGCPTCGQAVADLSHVLGAHAA